MVDVCCSISSVRDFSIDKLTSSKHCSWVPNRQEDVKRERGKGGGKKGERERGRERNVEERKGRERII